MFQNIYDSGVNGSTPCERKDVAHEAPAAEEETLLSLTGFIDNAKRISKYDFGICR
jgi:hypothetical protein